MNWIQLFFVGSHFNLWNIFNILTLMNSIRKYDLKSSKGIPKEDDSSSANRRSKTCLGNSYIDSLIPDNYYDNSNTTYENKTTTSIILFPRSYNLNIIDEPPISDFNVSLEILNSYFIYYQLLKLLENDKVSIIKKIQNIENNEITKEINTSSYAFNLFKNLMYEDW